MKIVMVITRGDDLGGAQMHVKSLCEGLLAAGHQVQVIAGIGGTWADAMIDQGIPVSICAGMPREIDPRQDLAAIRRLNGMFRSLSPDLICAHSSKAGLLARIAAKISGIPCVFTAHGWAFTEGIAQPKKAVFKALERITAPLAAKVICVSDFDRKIALRAGFKASRLVTIHNGVPDIEPGLRATPSSDGPVRVVMVARFADQKDQELLITAVNDLPQIHLDFVGDGPKLGAAKRLVNSFNMGQRVRFHGVKRDVAEILSHAHIFALTTNFEGFPLSTLEGMRAGLPIVVSDVGGAAEAIVSGESGFVVPRGDVATLRDRLILLAEKPERRELMGTAARRRYEAEFSSERMLTRTIDLYQQVRTRDRPQRSRRGSSALPARTAVIRTSPERTP